MVCWLVESGQTGKFLRCVPGGCLELQTRATCCVCARNFSAPAKSQQLPLSPLLAYASLLLSGFCAFLAAFLHDFTAPVLAHFLSLVLDTNFHTLFGWLCRIREILSVSNSSVGSPRCTWPGAKTFGRNDGWSSAIGCNSEAARTERRRSKQNTQSCTTTYLRWMRLRGPQQSTGC
jgi:hypothetical protein